MKLTIDAKAVTLDGRSFGDARALESMERPQRIEPLYFFLRSRLQDGHRPELLEVEVDDDAPHVVVVSALQTAAQAGFHRMRFGDLAIAYDAVPGDGGRFDDAHILGNTVVLRAHRQVVGVAWQSTAPCDQVPADRDVPMDDVGAELGTRPIAGVKVQLADDARFEDALALVRQVATHQKPDFWVSFHVERAGAKSPRVCGLGKGRIAPEEIQRVVRSHFSGFRRCYEDGLRANASLGGRVAIRFVIGLDGRVQETAVDPSTTLPDARVHDCIRAAYTKLTFPPPNGGTVTVVYPLIFNPGD